MPKMRTRKLSCPYIVQCLLYLDLSKPRWHCIGSHGDQAIQFRTNATNITDRNAFLENPCTHSTCLCVG